MIWTKIQNDKYKPKQSFKFFQRRNLILALFLLILASATFIGIKQKKEKAVVSGASENISDKIPGWWLKQYFSRSVCDVEYCEPDADPDKDKLTNAQEYYYHSDPLVQDTNKNGLNDGEDVANNYDPSKPGKISLDEVASDDSIMGESLVFDKEVKQLIYDMTDVTKVILPEVKTEEITLAKIDTKQARAEYFLKLNETVEKYFNFNVQKSIEEAAQTGDSDKLTEIKIRALKLLGELKALPVPQSAVQFHKYYIGMISLMPQVVSFPGVESLGTDHSNAEDIWFDHAQAYLVLLQKISLEKQKIKQLP